MRETSSSYISASIMTPSIFWELPLTDDVVTSHLLVPLNHKSIGGVEDFTVLPVQSLHQIGSTAFNPK